MFNTKRILLFAAASVMALSPGLGLGRAASPSSSSKWNAAEVSDIFVTARDAVDMAEPGLS